MLQATKSFRVRGREFHPCACQDSLDQGYRWYSVVTHGRTGLTYGELDSPRCANGLQGTVGGFRWAFVVGAKS